MAKLQKNDSIVISDPYMTSVPMSDKNGNSYINKIHHGPRNSEMFNLTYALRNYHMPRITSARASRGKEGTPRSFDDCGASSSAKIDEIGSSSKA
ncbi:hypothetical protein Tco_1122576 [Tanacetum coccineum]|uniref:Uncharacterized protein n=1 Tax=Tanacetum coccineum TaxID=301880 RepID=A0ABQ5J0X5_9ASTR